MNEQTVPVPVTLLKRLRDDRQLRFVDPGGALYNVYDDAMAPLIDLIPVLPKVGDMITAETIAALPPGSVLRDNIDDVWIVGPGGRIRVVNRTASGDPDFYEVFSPSFSDYQPVLISLPRD